MRLNIQLFANQISTTSTSVTIGDTIRVNITTDASYKVTLMFYVYDSKTDPEIIDTSSYITGNYYDYVVKENVYDVLKETTGTLSISGMVESYQGDFIGYTNDINLTLTVPKLPTKLVNVNKTVSALAIGGKSTAKDDEELFENYMPSKFYKDIAVNGKATFNENVNIAKDSNGTKGIKFGNDIVLRQTTSGVTVISSQNNAMSFRPNGNKNTNEAMTLNTDGSLNISGNISAKTFQNMYACNTNNATGSMWLRLCTIKRPTHSQGSFAFFRIHFGKGNNGNTNQNAFIDLSLQQGWTGANGGRYGGNYVLYPFKSPFNLNNVKLIVTSIDLYTYEVWFWTTSTYCRPSYSYDVDSGVTIEHDGNTFSTTEPTSTKCNILGEVVCKVSDLFYSSGNTYNVDNIVMPGHITSSSTTIQVTINVPKRLDNITSISCTSLSVESRGIKGYLNSASGFIEYVGNSNYRFHCTKLSENTVGIAIIKSSAFTNCTNNTPVTLWGKVSLTFN